MKSVRQGLLACALCSKEGLSCGDTRVATAQQCRQGHIFGLGQGVKTPVLTLCPESESFYCHMKHHGPSSYPISPSQFKQSSHWPDPVRPVSS